MSSAPAEEKEELAEGTLLSHLVELRSRLLKSFAAIMIVFVPLVPFAQKVFEFASGPLRDALPGGQLISTRPIDVVFVPFKLTFFVAIFIAMPVILYQAWAFVAPGLYRREKQFALPLLMSSILLFYAGVAFAYYVVFPLIFTFVVGLAASSEAINVLPDIADYLSLLITLVLAFGLAFEVPVATVLMVWTGLTTPQKLAKARPYVFLMAFVIGMFLTPPDMISQTLLAVPVYLLYEIGILMARLFSNARDKRKNEAVAAE